jgi:hypothetical protein
MLETISNSSYEEMNEKESTITSSLINLKNLRRVVRVRNILKSKKDPDNDFLGINNIGKFKEDKRQNDNELIMTLQNLGPPSFIKTRFKKDTIEKYKIVNGKYFGCMV